MTPEQFCYWLQGALEIRPDDNYLCEEQVQQIRDHLQLVFKKETPTPGVYSIPADLHKRWQEITHTGPGLPSRLPTITC